MRRVRTFNRMWLDCLDPGAEEPTERPTRPPSVPVEVRSEVTPNPNARKFLCSTQVTDSALSFVASDEVPTHPIARAVFSVAGTREVFAVGNFVTVTRDPQASWELLAPQLEAALRQALSKE